MRHFGNIIFAALCAVSVTACGKLSGIVQEDLAIALCSAPIFSEQLSAVDSSTAERLLNINPNDYSELTMYVGSEATAEEIVIISSTDTDTVEEKLQTYLEAQKSDYSAYRPAETTKIDNAFMTDYRGTVVMVVSADTAAAETAYNNYLKK